MNSLSSVWATRLSSATLLAASAILGTVDAAENILVMGEDADGDYVPCDNRAFVAVRDAVANQLGDNGFRVYDETAVTIDTFDQTRCRRTDAELINAARSITKAIDVAVLYRLYAVARQMEYGTKISARIEGRMLDVHSGQRLGSIEVDRQWPVPSACQRECLLEAVRKSSRSLGEDLGALLALKLSSDPSGSAPDLGSGGDPEPAGRVREYTLEFENFAPEDIEKFDDYLKIFSCYSEHRPTRISPASTTYAYHSCISIAKLSSNLNRVLEQMLSESSNRWSATINMSGNMFTIRKLVRRNVRRTQDEGEFQW